MLSDIEIAQGASMLPISKVAEKLGIGEDELECYGKDVYKRQRLPRAARSKAAGGRFCRRG